MLGIMKTAAMIVLWLGVVGCVVRGDVAAPADDVGQRLADVVDRWTLGQFWGVVIVAVDGNVVFVRDDGFANSALDRVSALDSLFDVGSIAKSVTAAAALSLAEDGVLDLDAPVSEVLGRDLGRAGGATTRELLGHVGGVGSLRVDFRGADLETREGLLDALARATGPDDEGAFVYSNVGYFLVAAVVEHAAGEAFEEVVRERVFDEAMSWRTIGGDDARSDGAGFVGDGAVHVFQATARVSQRGPGSDTFSYPWNWGQRGATGVVTTGYGLVAWMDAIANGQFLSDESRAAMLRSGKGGYGLGWYVEVDDAGEVTRFGHGGATGGYRSAAWHYPQAGPKAGGGSGVTIVVLTNEAHDADGMERALARVVAPMPSKPMRGGVFLLRYPDEDGDGLVRVDDGLAWDAMASYSGRGRDGERIVEDRPTLILRDSLRSMWSVMVHMDAADALDLAGRVERLLDAAGPAAAPGAGSEGLRGLSAEFDIRGRALTEGRSVMISEGLGLDVASAGGGVVLRMRDGDGVVATVRMGAAEGMALAERLRSVGE